MLGEGVGRWILPCTGGCGPDDRLVWGGVVVGMWGMGRAVPGLMGGVRAHGDVDDCVQGGSWGQKAWLAWLHGLEKRDRWHLGAGHKNSLTNAWLVH